MISKGTPSVSVHQVKGCVHARKGVIACRAPLLGKQTPKYVEMKLIITRFASLFYVFIISLFDRWMLTASSRPVNLTDFSS